MIQEFVKRLDENRDKLLAQFSIQHPGSYSEIVRSVVEILHDNDKYDSPDPGRIHEINDGDCSGTLVFIIGASGYQPSRYWGVTVDYGSCSACDTLEAIHSYNCDNPPTEQQANKYMQLAINIVQQLKSIHSWGELSVENDSIYQALQQRKYDVMNMCHIVGVEAEEELIPAIEKLVKDSKNK